MVQCLVGNNDYISTCGYVCFLNWMCYSNKLGTTKRLLITFCDIKDNYMLIKYVT